MPNAPRQRPRTNYHTVRCLHQTSASRTSEYLFTSPRTTSQHVERFVLNSRHSLERGPQNESGCRIRRWSYPDTVGAWFRVSFIAIIAAIRILYRNSVLSQESPSSPP